MTKVISLVAAMVVVTLFAAQALAVDYEFRLCDRAGDQCSRNYVTKTEVYEPGQLVSFFVDIDEVVAGDLCRVEYYTVFPSGQMEFVDARRVQTDTEAPVACTTDPNFFIPDGCPHCDTEVHCIMEDFFDNGTPAKIGNPAEMELVFRVTAFNDPGVTTGLFRDWFYIDKWTEDGCGELVDGGTGQRPLGILVTTVPEPGEIAGLTAGASLLWVLGRRHARRNE